MYIPWWFIIIVAIVGLVLYSRHNQKRLLGLENEPLNAEAMWAAALHYKEAVIEKSPLIEDFLQDERDMVKAMEVDMIRLKQRFQHDPKKLEEIAQDWMNYTKAVKDTKFSREMLDVDMDDNALENHWERTKEPSITIEEVAKRVGVLLGAESQSKVVHNRIDAKSEAVRNMSAADMVSKAVQASKESKS